MSWNSYPAALILLSTCTDAMSTVLHKNKVPPFVEEKIERRPGCLLLALLCVCHAGKVTATISTSVKRVNGRLEAPLLFNCSDRRVTDVNELELSNSEATTLYAFVFAHCQALTVMRFNALSAPSTELTHPAQRHCTIEDIVISSLVELERYVVRRKKRIHKSGRRHGSALRADPSPTHTALSAQAINATLMRKIVGFNKVRTPNKPWISAYINDKAQWMTALANTRDQADIASKNAKPSGTAICRDIGGQLFQLNIANDPEYDQFGTAIQCNYRAIRKCIVRRGTERHLLRRRRPCKTHIGGVPGRSDWMNANLRRSASWTRRAQALFAVGAVHETRFSRLDAHSGQTLQTIFAGMVCRGNRPAKRVINIAKRMAP